MFVCLFFSQLAELKQECLARGLETKGIKQDLINSLQAYLEEHAEEEANEEDALGDETEEEEPKPIELPVKEEEPPEKAVDVASEKKVVKITSGIPQTEVSILSSNPLSHLSHSFLFIYWSGGWECMNAMVHM